jgi:elongator complex protein 2
MMECVALHTLPESSTPIIATAGLDFSIHIFAKVDDKFNKMCSLQGHEDWIRCLNFTTCDDGSVMLASASQDTRIRLWKISKGLEHTEKLQQLNVNV